MKLARTCFSMVALSLATAAMAQNSEPGSHAASSSAPASAPSSPRTIAPSATPGSAIAEESASSSLLVTSPAPPLPADKREDPSALRQVSLFAIAPIEPRKFAEHDLVQIIVRESTLSKSTHDMETKKTYDLNGQISNWNDILSLLTLGIHPANSDPITQVQAQLNNDFKGEADYKRQDDMTARVTAEVVEVLPNGNLVLEARTYIKNDKEESSMTVTGVCRAEDVSAANTVMSNQIHDLKVEKENKGYLKQCNSKGIIAQALDLIFSF